MVVGLFIFIILYVVFDLYEYVCKRFNFNFLIFFFFYNLNPQNNHQLPSIIILYNPHLQKTYKINYNRQLSNHNIKIQIFIPNHTQIPAFIKNKLKLFNSSNNKKTSNLQNIINIIKTKHIVPTYIIFYIY